MEATVVLVPGLEVIAQRQRAPDANSRGLAVTARGLMPTTTWGRP